MSLKVGLIYMSDIVLVVDDDMVILNMLSKALSSSCIESDLVDNGATALEMIAAKSYDLIMLDINMKGINGFELLQKIRNDDIHTPIMLVSGRKEDQDALYGLEIGADDYVTKPFNPITLVAKAKALIRRSRSASDSRSTIEAGPFKYDTSTLKFYKNDVEIPLSSKENAMIKLFVDNIGHIFSKDVIYSLVWGEIMIDENAIMVYINRLRQKIEDEPSNPRHLLTVRGIGYKFVV